MTKKEFDERLDSLELTRQVFAQLTGLSYGSVTNWSDEKKPVPSWVSSWLSNYKKAKNMEQVVEAVQSYIDEENNA